MQAFGENDVISVYSPVLQTMTTEPFRPDASTVVAPANGGEAKVLDIVLQWKNTTLEYFGKTIYDVYMGTADDDLQLIAEGITETSLNPGELEENTTYYWQVDAINDIGLTESEIWSFKVLPGGTIFYTDFSTTPASFANSDWGLANKGAQKDIVGAGKTASYDFDNLTIGSTGGRIVSFQNLGSGSYPAYSSNDNGASNNAIGFIGKNKNVKKAYIHISEIEGPWTITVFCGNSDSSAQSIQLSTGEDINGDGVVNDADDLATFKFSASSKKMFKFTHSYNGTVGNKIILDRASLDNKGINFHDIRIERYIPDPAGIEDVTDNSAMAPDIEVLGDAVTVNNLNNGASVQVVDMTGRTVFMQKADNGSIGFVLAGGVYVVRVSDMKPVKIAIR